MKNFNQSQDKELNTLAVAFVEGEDNGKYFEVLLPLLTRYANRSFSHLEKDDLLQEFALVAIRVTNEFVEKYNDGKNNVLGLIYTACKRRIIDLQRNKKAVQRTKYNEVSFETPISEGEELTLSDRETVSHMATTEQKAIGNLEAEELFSLLNEFAEKSTKKNSVVIGVVLKGVQLGLCTEEVNVLIGQTLNETSGKQLSMEAIRKAKSRALKAFTEFAETSGFTF